MSYENGSDGAAPRLSHRASRLSQRMAEKAGELFGEKNDGSIASVLVDLSGEAREVADDASAKICMALENIYVEHQRLVSLNKALLEQSGDGLRERAACPQQNESVSFSVSVDAVEHDPAAQDEKMNPAQRLRSTITDVSGATDYMARVESKRRSPAELLRQFALAQGWLKPPSQQNSSLLVKFVNSLCFDGVCAGVIILNCLLLALSTDFAARHRIYESRNMPTFYQIADLVCNFWFLFELLLRMVAETPCVFFSCLSKSWGWNMFDTIVVALSLLEVVLTSISDGDGGGNYSALRIMRAMRAARALRIVRLVRIFKELRMMVLSLLNSFTTLMWALLLLFILIFIFSIFLAQNVTTYLHKDGSLNQPKNYDSLSLHFGSLTRSMYTLFISVTNGISWYEISDPLFEIGWTTGAVFCFYIFFTIFAMLNIITGIFLESALTACKSDQDECISEQLHAEDSALRSMQKIFKEADDDESGSITGDEFLVHLQNPRMRAHLASIGIEVGEAEGLFDLLDLDGSGAITIDEFLYGCMRLKGTAKAVDVQTLLYENKKMFAKWNTYSSKVENNFRMLTKIQDRLGTLTALVKDTHDRSLPADHRAYSPNKATTEDITLPLRLSPSSGHEGKSIFTLCRNGRCLL